MTINSTTTPQSKETIQALWRLEKIILDSLDFSTVVQKIVDSALTELDYLKLGYRIIVLALVDKEKGMLKRISISQTAEARKALEVTPVPFKEIEIPLTAVENYCIRALLENQHFYTHDWVNILCPPYFPEEARKVQKIVGIQTSMVYPVSYHGETQGIMLFSMVKDESEVSTEEKDLIQTFTDIVGLAVQNAKLYTSVQEKTEQLRRANEELKQLDHLKDEFISLASHELKAPLSAIKGSLSTIVEGYTGEIPVKTKEFLEAAYNENDRLIRLVTNLLNVSRIEAGRFTFTVTRVDLNKLITEVVDNFQLAFKEKGITLNYKEDISLPAVVADPDKLREVVINIISNAMKFTKTGGVTVSTQVQDRMVLTTVEDTGPGIAVEEQGKLFQKFSQAQEGKLKSGGTGLGLYISKQIVDGLGGKIWFESQVGKGTIFSFTIPKAV